MRPLLAGAARALSRPDRILVAIAGLVGISALTASGHSVVHEYRVSIPSASDWTDCGTILVAGKHGDWDLNLWGGFATSVLRRSDGQFLLYYQGADGYNEQEGTVTNRAIGVAVGGNGIRFQKYTRNPILTYSPQRNHEEGAVSSAAFLDVKGHVVMYHGANTWIGGDQVNADARLAVSNDGLRFMDSGIALSHRDKSVWGSGDELFPVAAFQHEERRIVYYIPNGGLQRDLLGVAWGDGPSLTKSSSAMSGSHAISAWGSASVVCVGEQVYALFVTYGRGAHSYMEVRTVVPDAPSRLSAAVRKYEWPGIVPTAVLRDEENDQWYLYYRDEKHTRYGVMIAGGQGNSVCEGKRDAVER